MKPEPLKNKLIEEQIEGAKFTVGKIVFNEPMAKKSDVKSAVEWLKEKHKVGDMSKEDAIKLIDEAFEDVVEKH